MSDPGLSVTDSPAPADVARLGEGLGRFNEGLVGPAERRTLAVFLRVGDRPIDGGLWGYTAWGWLYVQLLWLDAPVRGRGWAGHLLAAAEAEARARGCHGAWIDTFSAEALRVYRRAGYAPFGQLDDFPRGRARVFLQKSLEGAVP